MRIGIAVALRMLWINHCGFDSHLGYMDKKLLIERGIKENKCECCGLSEWIGKPIPLELHHKDFNHYNNSLDNLQVLCANCHMQAHNYCNSKK